MDNNLLDASRSIHSIGNTALPIALKRRIWALAHLLKECDQEIRRTDNLEIVLEDAKQALANAATTQHDDNELDYCINRYRQAKQELKRSRMLQKLLAE